MPGDPLWFTAYFWLSCRQERDTSPLCMTSRVNILRSRHSLMKCTLKKHWKMLPTWWHIRIWNLLLSSKVHPDLSGHPKGSTQIRKKAKRLEGTWEEGPCLLKFRLSPVGRVPFTRPLAHSDRVWEWALCSSLRGELVKRVNLVT